MFINLVFVKKKISVSRIKEQNYKTNISYPLLANDYRWGEKGQESAEGPQPQPLDQIKPSDDIT